MPATRLVPEVEGGEDLRLVHESVQRLAFLAALALPMTLLQVIAPGIGGVALGAAVLVFCFAALPLAGMPGGVLWSWDRRVSGALAVAAIGLAAVQLSGILVTAGALAVGLTGAIGWGVLRYETAWTRDLTTAIDAAVNAEVPRATPTAAQEAPVTTEAPIEAVADHGFTPAMIQGPSVGIALEAAQESLRNAIMVGLERQAGGEALDPEARDLLLGAALDIVGHHVEPLGERPWPPEAVGRVALGRLLCAVLPATISRGSHGLSLSIRPPVDLAPLGQDLPPGWHFAVQDTVQALLQQVRPGTVIVAPVPAGIATDGSLMLDIDLPLDEAEVEALLRIPDPV